MTIFDDQIEPTIDLQTILEHPLPVWYENILTGLGNGIVSIVYVTDMGAACGEGSWRYCVLNPEYWESYDRFVERKLLDEVWIHKLVWKKPTTGEVKTYLARAKWISDHEILGEVTEWTEIEVTLDHSWLVYRILLFAAGLGTGYVGGFLWPIAL